MIAQPFAFAPARLYQRLTWLTVAGLLAALLIPMPPIVRPDRTASPSAPISADTPARPSPAPATAQIPAGLGPVLNATLAADDAQEYGVTALASSPDALRAGNPAQRFMTTFGADGVQITPASGAAVTLRATTIITAGGTLPLAAVPPASVSPRVEYRRDALTEWYVNGPRGLEQGFTLDAPPNGAPSFTLGLAITGAVPTQGADGALLLGDLRYGDLTVTDAAGATLPAHLDVADGTIQIAVDARGAQWPVTIDPLITQATITPQTPPGNTRYYFPLSIAMATANGTTTVVAGAPDEFVGGTQDDQGAVYVFTGSGGTYTQRAHLTASDGSRQQYFGQSVAVVISGGTTTIVVGAPNAEKVYVYTGSGGAYTEQARLVSPDPTGYGSYFGGSVAAASSGGTTTIAVGALVHGVGTQTTQGSAYVFAGSGASYPLQVELNDVNGYSAERFGQSVTLVSNGGTNTVAVGANFKGRTANGTSFPGSVFVFTGSGASYSSVELFDPNGQTYDNLGDHVAVGVKDGITTVAATAPAGANGRIGVVDLFTGSGTSYTQTKLADARGSIGTDVAVGYSYSQTLVAVGASALSGTTGNPADGVLLFTQTGATYTESSLPHPNGTVGDGYGASVAMVTSSSSDPTVVAGIPNINNDALGIAFVSSWSAQASVQAMFGDGAQTVASPATTYSGTPFHLVARVVDGNGVAIPPTGVTFAVNPVGGTGGRFTASDPASTTLHTTTHDGTGGTTAGQTDTLSLSPSSTSGAFTVSATADGTALSATYTLKIIPSAPVPTLNAVVPARTGGVQTSGVARNTVTGQPAGLSPAMVVIDTSKTYEIHVTGTGFLPQALGTRSFYKHGSDAAYQMDTVYNSATDLSVFVPGGTLFPGLTADTTAQISVYNPPSHAGGTDGGTSNALTLVLAVRRSAPASSSLSCSGAMSVLVPPSSLVVAPPCQVVDGQGHPVPSVLTGTATGFVGGSGGELVGPSGGTLISQDGAGVISDHGVGLISQDGAGVISNDGGSLVSAGGGNIAPHGAAQPATAGTARAVAPGSAPMRTAANAATSDYIASTDANSIIMAPPVLSNGIPGTYARSLSVDGIAQPVAYTFTNLNPHDGHPATITSLSSTHAYTGAAAFTLTATGTGFVNGSVLSYGGVQLATTFISATQVAATVPANLLKYAGALDVAVINPDPNGGASLPTTFVVGPFVNPLPPPQPPGSPAAGTGPSPLPGGRPPAGPPLGNPNPLPTGR
jgi:hypothetical protein